MPKLPWQIKAFSYNLLTTAADLALYLAAFTAGLAVSGRSTKGVHAAAHFAEGVSLDTITRAVQTSREKGWIKSDLTVTYEGQKRLSSLLPQIRSYPRRWNNTWYLISFDIPRNLNYKRDCLRQECKRLGFGKLHDSLWIAPQNFLGDVLEHAKTAHIEQHLIPAISKELGKARSRDLADQVWNLRGIDMQYLKFINALAQGKPATPELFLQYTSALSRDPFLPVPLLPEGWFGAQAHALAQKTFPQMMTMLKKEGVRLKEEYTEKDPREFLNLISSS